MEELWFSIGGRYLIRGKEIEGQKVINHYGSYIVTEINYMWKINGRRNYGFSMGGR